MIRRREIPIRWRSSLAEEEGKIFEGAERLVMEREDHREGGEEREESDGRDHVSVFQS